MDVPGPPPVKLKINSNIFKELATEWNMQKEMDGMISGIVIEKNLRTAPAPSSLRIHLVPLVLPAYLQRRSGYKSQALPNRNNDGGEHSQLGVSQPAKTENSPSGYGHKCFKYSGTDKFPDKSNDNKAYDIGNIKSGSEKSSAFDLGFQKCGKKMASTFTISTVPMA